MWLRQCPNSPANFSTVTVLNKAECTDMQFMSLEFKLHKIIWAHTVVVCLYKSAVRKTAFVSQ